MTKAGASAPATFLGSVMKKVLIQGAFDILNYGHIEAFKFAKSHGDFLIVALNTNSLIKDYKRRIPVMPWWQKKRIIEAVRYVDKVIAAPDFSPIKLLEKHKIDVYVITEEWVDTKAKEMAFMKKKGGKTVISGRTKGVSTTNIKKRLLKEYLDATHSKVVPRERGLRIGRQTAKHHSNGSMPPTGANKRPAGALR